MRKILGRLRHFGKNVLAEKEKKRLLPRWRLSHLFIYGKRKSEKKSGPIIFGARATSYPALGSREDRLPTASEAPSIPTRATSWTSAAMLKSIGDDEDGDSVQDIGHWDDCSSFDLSDLSIEDSDHNVAELYDGVEIADAGMWPPRAPHDVVGCVASSNHSLGDASSCSHRAGSQSQGWSSLPSITSSMKSAINGGWPAVAAEEHARTKEEEGADDEESVEAQKIKSAMDRGWPGTSFAGMSNKEQEEYSKNAIFLKAANVARDGVAATSTSTIDGHERNIWKTCHSDRNQHGMSSIVCLSSSQASPSMPSFGPAPSKWILRACGGRMKCDELEQANKCWDAAIAAPPSTRGRPDSNLEREYPLPECKGACARSA